MDRTSRSYGFDHSRVARPNFQSQIQSAAHKPVNADIELLKADIVRAFASVERPFALRGSNEGDEPYLLDEDFKDKQDWRTLDPDFLDQAPAGFASALSFFSDEAFRYFLPAYLIADLDGKLSSVDPAFHLWHGLDDATRGEALNPRRYGDRTWMDAKMHKFSVFSREQAAVILRYLQRRAANDDFDRAQIEQAIDAYWRARAA